MSVIKKWFIPNDETLVPYGPYTTNEILAKIQDGSLKLNSFIWSEKDGEDWRRLFEIDEFKSSISQKPLCKIPSIVKIELDNQKIFNETQISKNNKDLNNFAQADGHEQKSDYAIENIYRRYPRAPFESIIILHDQEQGYFYSSLDISEKGISIKVDKEIIFQPSDEVSVTVRNFPGMGTFSTHGVVLRKFKFHEQNILGFYFLHLNPNIRRHIAQYVFKGLKKLNQDQQAM